MYGNEDFMCFINEMKLIVTAALVVEMKNNDPPLSHGNFQLLNYMT